MTIAQKFLEHLNTLDGQSLPPEKEGMEEAGFFNRRPVGTNVSKMKYVAAQARNKPPQSRKGMPQTYHVAAGHPPLGNIITHQHTPPPRTPQGTEHIGMPHPSSSEPLETPSSPTTHIAGQWNRDISRDSSQEVVSPPRIVSFNDFKQGLPPYHAYEEPIDPLVIDPVTRTGPRPTYDFSHAGGLPPLGGLRGLAGEYGASAIEVGKGLGRVGIAGLHGAGVGAGKVWGGTYGVKAGGRYAFRKAALAWNARKEAQKTRAALGSKAPERVVREVVDLKQEYPEYSEYIDSLAKDLEQQTQRLDASKRRALQLYKKTIQRRYDQIGKTLAKAHGRSEAWRIVAATPRTAWNAYRKERERIRAAAEAQRDQQLLARENDIQNHEHTVYQWREQYLGQIRDAVKEQAERDRKLAVGESFAVVEGKARNFSELVRNKKKVRDRHVRALKQGTMLRSLFPVDAMEKENRRKSRSRRRQGEPATMDQWQSRRRSVLHRKLRSALSTSVVGELYPPERKSRRARASASSRRETDPFRRTPRQQQYGSPWDRVRSPFPRSVSSKSWSAKVGEAYYGRHPVFHTAGQVITSPVTVPTKAIRSAARFTGVNELPQVARDVHADAKHQFIHGFLLR
jgi:hypothetical protein